MARTPPGTGPSCFVHEWRKDAIGGSDVTVHYRLILVHGTRFSLVKYVMIDPKGGLGGTLAPTRAYYGG